MRGAEALGEMDHDGLGQGGLGPHHVEERVPGEDEHGRGVKDLGRRGAQTAVDDGELAERVVGLDHADDHLSARLRGGHQLDQAARHDDQGAAGVAFVEDGLAPAVAAHYCALGEALEQRTVDAGEQGRPGQQGDPVFGVHYGAGNSSFPVARSAGHTTLV